MERKAKQRFLKLKVNEISLVDSPANEQEFLVAKRLDKEKTTMAQAASETSVEQVVAKAAADGIETVAIEVEKNGEGNVEAVMGHVANIVANITKSNQPSDQAVDASKPATADTTVDKGCGGGGGGPGKKEDVMWGKMKKALKDMKMSDADVDKAITLLQTLAKADEKVAKAVEQSPTDQPAATGEDAIEKTMTALVEGITKAKAFTPKRAAALKEAVTKLSDLIKELEDVQQGTSPKNDMPKTAQVPPATLATPTSVSKNVDADPVLAKINELAVEVKKMVEASQALNTRVETIEKARNPSTSVGPNGGNDVQVQKSIWNGLL
jgi:hypothetical protein